MQCFISCVTPIDKSWREKAEKELNETNESYTKVKQLRSLLTGCDLNGKGREDEAFLLRFLRAKKFDVDKAFKMIQKYYWMKEHSAALFHVSPPSDLKMMLEMQIQSMLPQKDNHGRQVYVFRVGTCLVMNSNNNETCFERFFSYLTSCFQRNVILIKCALSTSSEATSWLLRMPFVTQKCKLVVW